jgi:hypothetical protein
MAIDCRKFHSLGHRLRRELPLELPLSIRLQKLPRGAVGECDRHKDRFAIRIAKDLDTEEALGTLLHEAAHALAWGLDGVDDHGMYFCMANRTVWGIYMEWLKERTQ